MSAPRMILHLILPQRFFRHGQLAQGDRHVYASRTRFIDGQPHASRRDGARARVTSQSMPGPHQVRRAMQVSAGHRAAKVPNARWRGRQ